MCHERGGKRAHTAGPLPKGLMEFYLRSPSLSHPELPHTALVSQPEGPEVCWQIPSISDKHMLLQMLLTPESFTPAQHCALVGHSRAFPHCPPEGSLCSLPEGLWGELTPQ